MSAPASASKTASAVRSGRRSAENVVRAALEAAHAGHDALNAFTQLFDEHAIGAAREIDAAIARGDTVGPLAGVPVAIKDNLCTTVGRTTAGSRMLAGYESPFAATAVTRLERAGAVVIGKTNLDEFAMGSSGEHSAFGPTRNPWDTDRVPGGSSSGSAAAVASGAVPLSLGSDTGGSIRQPAALCGLVGVKPTYGRVSRLGLIAFASSLDQVGPFARSVDDAALAMAAICAHDPGDSTSEPNAQWGGEPERDPSVVVAIPAESSDERNHPAVHEALERVGAALRDDGAKVVDGHLPHAAHGIAAYYIVAPAEASSNLARFDGVRYGHRAEARPGDGLREMYVRSRSEGFGREVKSRIMLGTQVLRGGYADAYYTTALRTRRLIKQDFDRLFDQGVDAVLMPTTTGPAFGLGEKTEDPLALYLEDLYTVGVNLAGLPAVSIPAGFAEVGGRRLPIGVQLIGRAFEDERLLALAKRLETALALGPLVAPAV